MVRASQGGSGVVSNLILKWPKSEEFWVFAGSVVPDYRAGKKNPMENEIRTSPRGPKMENFCLP